MLGKLSSSLTALGKHSTTNKEDRGTGQLPASGLQRLSRFEPAPHGSAMARLGSTSCPGWLVPARLRLAPACGAATTLGQARVGFTGPGSELSYHSQIKSKKNGMRIGKGPRRRISPGKVICSPLSSVPSSQRASHFPRSSSMPHSVSMTIESNTSFVAASRNLGRV